MSNAVAPRVEYLRPTQWLRARIEARLRLPWLPWWLRIVRDGVVMAAMLALPVAAVVHRLFGAPIWLVAALAGTPLLAHYLWAMRTILRPQRRRR
jgi:hypothetical protein